MIKRIVKLTFQPKHTEEFKEIFRNSKPKILARKGCQHVECLQDVKHTNIFFTFSIWDSEEDLNAYRNSELFGGVWPKTKALFSEKPEAWSVELLSS